MSYVTKLDWNFKFRFSKNFMAFIRLRYFLKYLNYHGIKLNIEMFKERGALRIHIKNDKNKIKYILMKCKSRLNHWYSETALTGTPGSPGRPGTVLCSPFAPL